MIQRIFHPIGQGAFYSERHKNFNIVFDCGNWRNTKLSDKVVRQSFNKDEVIDILFMSHFDFDHISKIPTLKKHVKEIKRVVLPLLHDNEKILLINIYRALNFDFLTLINNPQLYFGEETKIINVEPTENNESAINDNIEPQNIDDIYDKSDDKSNVKIQSGTKIKLKDLANWIFLPFNYKYIQRNKDLISELKKEGFNDKKLKTDSKYTIDEIIKDTTLTKKQGGKKFKDIYDRLDGKINQNSMLLYSGPLIFNKSHRHSFNGGWNSQLHYYFDRYCYCTNKVACIYTGDSDFNITDIKTIYRAFWDKVGTIQIPHHGDIKTFKKETFKDEVFYCPISVGTKNSYGHPSSKVINDIVSSGSCPILITEKQNSMYVEIIV